jgi:competence protein ComEA
MGKERLPWLERYKYLVFLVIAIVLAAGIAVLLWRRPVPAAITVIPPEPTGIPSATPPPSATSTPGPYAVYVTGAVATPEIVVTLPYGSRVLHALEAAGGPAEGADLARVNLAQVLEDGDHVAVPTARSGAPGDAGAASGLPEVRLVTPTPDFYMVYIVGEVARPLQMLNLPAGSRVEDAIDAAGGITANADMSRVNPAQRLDDGDLVYIPPQEGDDIALPTPNRPLLIHINSATVDELKQLEGIGETKAQAIIDYREENGPFTSVDELLNVYGIGEKTLTGFRDQIVIDEGQRLIGQ